jgi:hypothetical protein
MDSFKLSPRQAITLGLLASKFEFQATERVQLSTTNLHGGRSIHVRAACSADTTIAMREFVIVVDGRAYAMARDSFSAIDFSEEA